MGEGCSDPSFLAVPVLRLGLPLLSFFFGIKCIYKKLFQVNKLSIHFKDLGNEWSQLSQNTIKKKMFVDLWLCWVFVAVLRFSLVSVSGAYSPVAVCGLLNVVAPLVTGRSF